MMCRRRRDSGSSTPVFVVGLGLALFTVVLLIQFVMWQYGRAAVRHALDSGARAGAPVDATLGDCEAAADQALTDLLGGSMAATSVSCAQVDGAVVATADVTMQAWLAPPDWSFTVSASAIKETAP